MSCFDDEKQKDNNIFKDKSHQNILCINAIVYYCSSFVLFLKTCIRDVSSIVIFQVQIE